MLKPWKFLDGDVNTKILTQGSNTLTFIPTLTSFLGVGIPTSSKGIITFYGPLCYVAIYATGSAIFGWNTNSYYTIPVLPLQTGGAWWPPQPLIGPLDPNTGVNQNTNKAIPTIVNSSGVAKIFLNDTSISNIETGSYVSGWFYRE